MSFLRKQESRLFGAAKFPLTRPSGRLAGLAHQGRGVLGSRLRGNDTVGLACQGRGDLFHTANLTVSTRPGHYNL